MNTVHVGKSGMSWVARCSSHGTAHWCGHWVAAMAAAYGHLVMHHEVCRYCRGQSCMDCDSRIVHDECWCWCREPRDL